MMSIQADEQSNELISKVADNIRKISKHGTVNNDWIIKALKRTLLIDKNEKLEIEGMQDISSSTFATNDKNKENGEGANVNIVSHYTAGARSVEGGFGETIGTSTDGSTMQAYGQRYSQMSQSNKNNIEMIGIRQSVSNVSNKNGKYPNGNPLLINNESSGVSEKYGILPPDLPNRVPSVPQSVVEGDGARVNNVTGGPSNANLNGSDALEMGNAEDDDTNGAVPEGGAVGTANGINVGNIKNNQTVGAGNDILPGPVTNGGDFAAVQIAMQLSQDETEIDPLDKIHDIEKEEQEDKEDALILERLRAKNANENQNQNGNNDKEKEKEGSKIMKTPMMRLQGSANAVGETYHKMTENEDDDD